MIRLRQAAVVSSSQNLLRRLSHRITTVIIVSVLAAWPPSQTKAEYYGKESSAPNIVFILADDKYECPEPNAQKPREPSRKPPFSRGFQITGNRGKLGRITGN
jgi:hypothetical protein